MNILPIDVLAQIALDLNLPDIISLCKSSKRFNYAVCLKESFWLNKLMLDYPDFRKYNLKNTSYREIYKLIYRYALPKYEEGKEYNILDLYKSVEMGLNTRKEFEEFVRQIWDITKLIVDYEGTNLLDFVWIAEDDLGSYEPLNSAQVVIVFDYVVERVIWVNSFEQHRNRERFLIIWAK